MRPTHQVREVSTGQGRYWTVELPEVPPDAEPAQQVFARLIRDGVAPELRKHGLKGSRTVFSWDRGLSRLGWVEFQKHAYAPLPVGFTINLAVARSKPGAARRPGGGPDPGYWGERIGYFLPEVADVWWSVPAGATTHELLADLLAVLQGHGLVALEEAMEETEHPPGPAPPLPAQRRHLPGDVFALYHSAPGDPHLLTALLPVLCHDHRAATMLAFVPCDSSVSLPALRAALAESPYLDVRVAVRHAIRTITRRDEGRSQGPASGGLTARDT